MTDCVLAGRGSGLVNQEQQTGILDLFLAYHERDGLGLGLDFIIAQLSACGEIPNGSHGMNVGARVHSLLRAVLTEQLEGTAEAVDIVACLVVIEQALT